MRAEASPFAVLKNMVYDAANRVLRVANTSAAASALFDYSYDKVANRTRMVESATGDVVTWTYDPTYQLLNDRRSGTDAYNTTFSYDPVGNRLVKNASGTRTTSTFDAANQLLVQQIGPDRRTITYDQNGNGLTAQEPGKRYTFTWDYENKLTRQHNAANELATFTYDPDGLLIEKDNPGEPSGGHGQFVWDEQRLLGGIEPSDGSMPAIATQEPAGYGNLISFNITGQGKRWPIVDALGSSRYLLDETATGTDSYVYDAFGDEIAVGGTSFNFLRYVGQQGYMAMLLDGLLYVRARWYVPEWGVWMSRDPVPLQINSQTNWYNYTGNNPSNIVDPTGKGWVLGFFIVVGIGGAIYIVWRWIWKNDPTPIPSPPSAAFGRNPKGSQRLISQIVCARRANFTEEESNPCVKAGLACREQCGPNAHLECQECCGNVAGCNVGQNLTDCITACGGG